MKKILLFCISIIATLTISAETIEQDGIRYWINFSKKTASIKQLPFDKVKDEVYTLPSVVRYEDEDYIVTSIEEKGIPNGRDNKICTKVIIPESITSIGENAFFDSRFLKEIVLPSQLTIIESGTFAQCQSLETITIPEGVTTIGSDAFKGCKSLESIIIPSSVRNIYDGAFQGTSIKELTLPNGMTTISNGAFSRMGKLQKINIPSSVNTIEENAFIGCERLQDVVLPPDLKTISSRLFAGCLNLEDIIIPDKVTTIGAHAFKNCIALKQINFPSSLKYIGTEAFDSCKELKTIYSYAVIPPTLHNYMVFNHTIFETDFNTDNTKTENIIYVPKNCSDRYKRTELWNQENYKEMDTDTITLPSGFQKVLEETHNKINLPPVAKDDRIIREKYNAIYESFQHTKLTAEEALFLYDIQYVVSNLLYNGSAYVLKKSVAGELKSAKTLEMQKQVFLKYLSSLQ